jgi:hypothetical protein
VSTRSGQLQTSLTNNGTLVASGGNIYVNNPSSGTFINNGTLSDASSTNGATFQVNWGTFKLGKGTINNALTLNGAALVPGTIPSGVGLTLYNSTIPGPQAVINSGALTLSSSSTVGPITNAGSISLSNSTVAGSLTNNGQISGVSDQFSAINGQFTNNGMLLQTFG